MSDILFKCPKCTKSLAVDESLCGEMVKCIDCSHPLRVPVPHIHFDCPACQNPFSAPVLYAGTVFKCCECQTDISIPVNKHPEKAGGNSNNEQTGNEPTRRGVAMPSLKDEDRKRMISNMFDRHDKFQKQLKKAREPKLIRFAKRILQYAIVSFLVWFITWLFNDKLAIIALVASIGAEVFILVCEMILFRGTYE